MMMLMMTMMVMVVMGDRCPDPLSIQDPSLATTFNLDQFFGPPYYELAKHDSTQPDSFVIAVGRGW